MDAGANFMNDLKALENKALELRKGILEMCVRAGTGHVTSSFSCAEILVALYHGGIMRFRPDEPEWAGRDRFIMSKGHASPALYVLLADLGFYPKSWTKDFAQKDGHFGVLLRCDVPGVEITSGSLGHGFGIAAGLALGARMNRELHLVFTLLGDGECYEGSMWETAMFASHNKLNNLVAILDRNRLCVTDFTENVVELEPFADKWKAFGWNVLHVDGHDIGQLIDVLAPLRTRTSGQPTIIIADTVKGKGIDRISNIPLWHGMAPKGAEADCCRLELGTSGKEQGSRGRTI
jgi:transketolase